MKRRQDNQEDKPRRERKAYQKRNKVKSKLKNIDLIEWQDFIEDSYKGNKNARDDNK